MKTIKFGIRLASGKLIIVKASTMERAKQKANEVIHAIWPIGKYWDKKGNPKP